MDVVEESALAECGFHAHNTTISNIIQTVPDTMFIVGMMRISGMPCK